MLTTENKKPFVLDKKTVLARIAQLEKREGVKVLYACESGSRAWGFASPDSDYDIRFVYIRPTIDYLRISPMRDVIEEPVDELWDLNGWDIKKALELLQKRNASLLEWMASPIVYVPNDEFVKTMNELTEPDVPNPSLWQSYRGMAKGNFKAYFGGETVVLKKYLYVIRPLLACAWLEAHDFKGTPPIDFETLMHAVVDDASLIEAINALLAKKRAGAELTQGARIPEIDKFINEALAREPKLPEIHSGKTSRDYDAVFLEMLMNAWVEDKLDSL